MRSTASVRGGGEGRHHNCLLLHIVSGDNPTLLPTTPLSLLSMDEEQQSEIASRRHEELEAMHAFYGEQLLPSLSSPSPSYTATSSDDNISSYIPIQGPWFIQLMTSQVDDMGGANLSLVPTLEIQLPPSYPLDADPSSSDNHEPTPILHNTDCHLTATQQQSLIDELKEMYEPNMNMDVGIMWSERCREEFLDYVEKKSVVVVAETSTTDDATCAASETQANHAVSNATNYEEPQSTSQIKLSLIFLSYNHLLLGKSHKKEAQLVSTASKMGLSGVVLYGTPGVVGVFIVSDGGSDSGVQGITTTRDDVSEFAKECGRLGKRAAMLDCELDLCSDGFGSSFLGELTSVNNQNGSSKKKVKCKSQSNSKSSNNKQRGIHKLFCDLLGEDRVIETNKSTQQLAVPKSGLTAFSSCVDFKKALLDHGLDDQLFQRIIGIA